MTTNNPQQNQTPHRPTAREEAAIIRRLSFVSIFGNAVLSGFKLFAGIAGNHINRSICMGVRNLTGCDGRTARKGADYTERISTD